MLPASKQEYQVKEGSLFINDARKHSWGKLEALICEKITQHGHAWNGTGIKTDICHLYITSDEEIKEVDWFYNTISLKPEPFKACENGDGYVNCNKYSHYRIDCKKIILTTDPNLIKDGVQAIDDEFLKFFATNHFIDKVELSTYHVKGDISGKLHYKIVTKQKVICTNDMCQGECENCDFMKVVDTSVIDDHKQEIVGYRLKPSIDKIMVDGILKNAMPKWNDKDKSVYFIKGHVGGSLVAKMKELQVLNLWFTPIYEDEEIKSDWVKEHHLEYYYKEGIMKEEPK
jgi:hypothetical protein